MPADVSIKALKERLRDLRGWRRRLAALLAGALSVLAMAPFFAWPVLWLTLPALVWLIDGAVAQASAAREPASSGLGSRLRGNDVVAAAAVGWWFGFGYFLAGLFWIGEAFLVEPEVFAVLLPVAVTAMPAGLALFYAAATGVAARFWSEGPGRVLVLALTLSAAEWARGHVFTGLPWNVLGYALTWPLPLMQSASVLGIYGLTLLVVLVFALPPVLWSKAPAGAAGRRTRGAAVAIALGPIALLAVAGQVRLATAPQSFVPGVKIRIVQPSVPQREKWRPENQRAIFLDHMRAVGGQPGRRDGQPCPHHACHLAGGGHALPAARLSRRARGHRPAAAGEDVSHHRRAASGARAGRRVAAEAHLQQPDRVRPGRLAGRAL